ncbi:MAG: ECF transporter S component [Clostridiales bacterium]|nr:ECF transporter S component [Clostridiales bacterium]
MEEEEKQPEVTEENQQNEVQQEKKEKRATSIIKAHFTAPRIAYMAIFTALAFVVTFFEFPIFPQASFLKLDFANVFFLIEGFMFGPVEAFVSICLKELLCFTKSATGGVGEVANLFMSTAYIIIPSIAYRFKRGKWWVCLYLVLACIVQTGVSLLVNRYINFPFFVGELAAEWFTSLWPFVIYFNLIKSVIMGVIVFIIYKPLSRFINITAQKYEKRMAAAKRKKKEASDEPKDE